MKHIGIVAVSTEGTALCYRTICLEGAALLGSHAYPEISLHNFPLSSYQNFIDRDDWDAVGEMMLQSAAKLVRGRSAIADMSGQYGSSGARPCAPARARALGAYRRGSEQRSSQARLQTGRHTRNAVSDGGS